MLIVTGVYAWGFARRLFKFGAKADKQVFDLVFGRQIKFRPAKSILLRS